MRDSFALMPLLETRDKELAVRQPLFIILAAFLFGPLLPKVAKLAVAGAYEGEAISERIVRTGKDLRKHFEVTKQLRTPLFETSTELQWLDERRFTDEDVESDGSKGDWHGFFEAAAAHKALRLQQTVRGLSLRIAQRLVDDGFFDDRPRTWREFKRRITAADREYNLGFSAIVLGEAHDGPENRKNLGYVLPGGSYEWVRVLRPVQARRLKREVARTFVLQIDDAPLLAGEKEEFHLTFDGVEHSLIAESHFIDYDISWRDAGDNTIVYTLQGRRAAVRPSNLLRLEVRPVAGFLRLEITDGAFDAEIAHDCERKIVGVIEEHRSWKGNLELARFEQKLSASGRHTVVDAAALKIAVPVNKIVDIRYRVQFLGCSFYSSEASWEKSILRQTF